MMLTANECLCLGELDYMTLLVDELARAQWKTFESPCFEPSAAFEKSLIKALIREDKRWKSFSVPLKKLKAVGLLTSMPDDLRGFSSVPRGPMAELYRTGWEYMTTSVRTILKKETGCLKVATDTNGLEQNYNEAFFLYKYGPRPGNAGIYNLKVGVRKKIEVRVPELYSHHPRCLWITRSWITGDVPEMSEKVFGPIREAIMETFEIQDVRPCNLLWDYIERCYWIVDPGIPTRKAY